MVLVNALNEAANGMIGNDEGKYIEERALINQMKEFMESNKLYTPFIKETEKGTKIGPISDEEKPRVQNKLWQEVCTEFFSIIPDPQMANSFMNEFESKGKLPTPNSRIASLQTDLIAYFIENLKEEYLNDGASEEIVNYRLAEFQKKLISPDSVLLDNPSDNQDLDESLEFFEMKKKELLSIIFQNNVK